MSKGEGEGRKQNGRKGKPKSKASGKRKPDALKKARARLESLMSANVRTVAKDPLRSHILAVAIQRPYSPSEFARDLEIDIGIASYHFKVLREKGILEIVERIKVGGVYKNMHRATESAFISNADWGQLDETMRPGFLGTIVHDFSARVTLAIEIGTMFERDDYCLYWAPQDLDEIAYVEQVGVIAWCIEESKRLEADTVQRRVNGESAGSFPVTFAIAGFLSPTHEQIKKHKAKDQDAKPKKAKPKKAKGKKAKGKRKAPTKRKKGKGKS